MSYQSLKHIFPSCVFKNVAKNIMLFSNGIAVSNKKYLKIFSLTTETNSSNMGNIYKKIFKYKNLQNS